MSAARTSRGALNAYNFTRANLYPKVLHCNYKYYLCLICNFFTSVVAGITDNESDKEPPPLPLLTGEESASSALDESEFDVTLQLLDTITLKVKG